MYKEIVALTSTPVGWLELSLVDPDPDDLVMLSSYDDPDFVWLAGCSLARTPGKDNWVDEQGGLPEYVCEIAKSIHEKRGMPISRAIAIAVGTIKNWAHGKGEVNADTRAKAAAALAQWTKMKAAARAS